MIAIIYEVNGSTELGHMKLVGRASDPICPEGNGWCLDPNDPNQKTVQLCAATCHLIRQDPGAIINIRCGRNGVVFID